MQMEKGVEKRQTSRVPVPIFIETFDQSFPMGVLKNISTDGMFVQSTEPKEIGTRMDLCFHIPDTQKKIRVTAEVVWVNYPPSFSEAETYIQPGRPIADNPGMGLRILNIASTHKPLLEEFIDRTQSEGNS